ncbi:MAG TPA: hypothetical protein VN516_08115, partial [Candidatus Baltobacteraceae bacterium]|nr:hypothetical protein [Candidatus Baltobacteraceae bacterium]
ENYLLLAAGGALFGTAVLMKQHAAIIAAWAGVSFACGKIFCSKDNPGRRLASVAVYGFSMLAPLGLCCLWLWCAGVFGKFKFWTFDYAREYASITPLSGVPALFWKSFSWVTTDGIMLWLLAAVGLVLVWFDARWKNSRGLLLGFCASSALAVCPDFYFRPHYFLIAVPALALLTGAAVSGVCRWHFWVKIMPRIYLLMVAITIATCAGPWFFMPKFELAREMYGFDPLPEAEIVANFIQNNSSPHDRMAVLGSEPEIYFLSHRHSATGYIYIYALSETQPFAWKMRQEMIAEIESRRPEFVVLSDLARPSPPIEDLTPSLFDWWKNYQTNYTLVGVADIISPTETTYSFGTNEVAVHGKIHNCALEIYQRKPVSSAEAEKAK